MDESEEIANSQSSGPISFDNGEDDTAESVGSGTVHRLSSASNSNFTDACPRRLYVDNGLRSIQEIPESYRIVFKDYPCFNRVQSLVMDDVLYTAEPLVVTAPTGSGKTVIFELAIVQLLMSFNKPSVCSDFKIVYMAPVKALCSEKLHDWARKFSKLNINCIEVTGDSDVADLNYLNRHHIVLTTPEKWDSLTRRWRDHCTLMKTVRLFLIDEVHILNDESRGPTLEAVVSRMKMLQQQQRADNQSLPSLRFIAVSATIPNVEDLAQWLGTLEKPAKYFRMEESMRPVQLKKVVKGYDSNFSGYMFDVHLSYKLKLVISQYSDGKPTLVFCSTRKSVLATAEVLAKMITFSFTETQKSALTVLCDQLVEKKVRDLAKVGIGCHHAGLVMTDRNLLESAFRDGLLPVLIATSTLAMGVNLPAHLVVIKSTQYYGNGGYQDYSDSQLLQMIGRAGRPQFDTTAVAVIMTKSTCEQKYVRLTAGTEPIQSSLHRHLVEHLNAEVVLGTVTDLPGAVDWMRSTFLFVRANRHPQQYGLSGVCAGSAVKINAKLQDMVQVELNGLAKYKLVETNGIDIRDTPAGRLMARYYVAFQTMKNFMQVQGEESLSDLLTLLARAAEFHDVQLRNDEKAALNALNSRKDGKPGLRFPIKGRIKDRECKVNCLLQSLLGGLHIAEPGLQQEAARVVRTAERLSRCLCEVVELSGQQGLGLAALLSAVLLHKCVRCQLWEVSALAARQLPRIGPVLAALLVAAGKTSLAAVAQSNPRDLERIVNRLPPFGNELRDAAAGVPQLTLTLERARAQGGGAEDAVVLQADIANLDSACNDRRHWVVLLAGDSDNRVIVYERFPISKLFQGTYYNKLDVSNCCAESIKAYLISESWVGIDCEKSIDINKAVMPASQEPSVKSTRKRTNFMDKIMKEAASRTDSTPSSRLRNNQGLPAGGMSLSQRFEQFKKTQNLKRLPSLALEDDDPDDPPPLQSVPRAAAPTSFADEVIVIEDDDPVDDWDVQVVPGSQRASSSALEYSAIPHQPTIRNFFKSAPAPVAAKPPAPSAYVDLDDSWGVPTPTLPACVDLDDSWDEDILHAAREADEASRRTIRWRAPTPPPGYVEVRAGCWDFNFDIGIEDLLRLSDDESDITEKVPRVGIKNEQDSLDFDKWCEQEDLAVLGHKTEPISVNQHKIKSSPMEACPSAPWTDKMLPYDKIIRMDKKNEPSLLSVDLGKSSKLSDSNFGQGDGWPDSDFTNGDKLVDEDFGPDYKWTDADLREADCLSDVNLQQFLQLPDSNKEWPKSHFDEINNNISDSKIKLTEGWPDADCDQFNSLSDSNQAHDDKWPDAEFEQGDSPPNSTPGLADNLPDVGCTEGHQFNDLDPEHGDSLPEVVSLPPTSLSCRGEDRVVSPDRGVREAEPSRVEAAPDPEDPCPLGRAEQRVVLPALSPASTEPTCAQTKALPEEKAAADGTGSGLEEMNSRRDREVTDEAPLTAISVVDNEPPPILSSEPPRPQEPSNEPLPAIPISHQVSGQESCSIKAISPVLAPSDESRKNNLPDTHVLPQTDTISPKLKDPEQARSESYVKKNSQTLLTETQDSTSINQNDTKVQKMAGVFKIVDMKEKQPGEGQSVNKIAQSGNTFLGVHARTKPTSESSHLLKFRPRSEGTDADDVISRLLADWSNGKPSVRSAAADLPAPASRVVIPAPSMLGALSGASARRTPAGVVSVVAAPTPPQEDAKKVDCVERILQEGVPTRLMGKGVVRTLNTDRLSAAGLIRGGGTVLSRKLVSGMSATLATVAKEEARKQASRATPSHPPSDPPSDLHPPANLGKACLEECARPPAPAEASKTSDATPPPDTAPSSIPPRARPPAPAEASKTSDATPPPATAPPSIPPRAPTAALGAHFSSPASLAKSSSSSSSRTPSILSSFIKIPNRGAAAQPSAPRPAGATKLDWFERLLAEPVPGALRRLPQPRTSTAKRKAADSPDPSLGEPKRPYSQSGLASPWAARLTLPLNAAQASRPSKYGGFSGSLSVTATRPRSTPPPGPAPRDQHCDVSPTFLENEDMPGVPWGRGHSPVRRTIAPRTRMDDELSIPPPTRGEHDTPGAYAFQDVDDGEAILFARSRARSRSRSPGPSPRYRRVEDKEGAWHGADDAYTPPSPTSSPSRPWEDVGDDADLWGDYPSAASLLSPAASSPAEHLFTRRHYDEDDNPEQSRQSPPSYSFSQSHSPSYSPAPPAPQCQDRQAFNWRPSLSSGWGSRAMESAPGDGGDDPYNYVPESTRAGRPRADMDPWPRGSPQVSRPPPVPPTPAPAGRLVLSLSPSPVTRRTPAYSKWDSYLD